LKDRFTGFWQLLPGAFSRRGAENHVRYVCPQRCIDLSRTPAVIDKEDLFHFHKNPNPLCPVGRNIHAALYDKLQDVQKEFEESLKKQKLSDVISDLYREIKKAG
jgi:hypothetical protein